MDKEKEIEGMVEVARNYSEKFANTPYYKGVYTDMEAIYDAGYRKADEVRTETIRECSAWLHKNAVFMEEVAFAREFDKAFGVEVDE